MNTVEIEGVTLHLAHPDELAIQWVGQDEVMRQLLAAWMVMDAQRHTDESAAAGEARRRQDHPGLRGGKAVGYAKCTSCRPPSTRGRKICWLPP